MMFQSIMAPSALAKIVYFWIISISKMAHSLDQSSELGYNNNNNNNKATNNCISAERTPWFNIIPVRPCFYRS